MCCTLLLYLWYHEEWFAFCFHSFPAVPQMEKPDFCLAICFVSHYLVKMEQMSCLFSGAVVAGVPTVVDFLACVVLRSENLLDSPLISLWSRRGNRAQSGEATCEMPSVLFVVFNVFFLFVNEIQPSWRALEYWCLFCTSWRERSTSVHKMSWQFLPSSSSETVTVIIMRQHWTPG